jgi:hypothetical protein
MIEPDDQPPPSTGQRQRAAELVDAWLGASIAPEPSVIDIEHMAHDQRWFVRLSSEEKGVFAVWLWLQQRRLHFEAYIVASPELDRARVFEYLLRQNAGTARARYCIAAEEAIYVRSNLPIEELSERVLDEAFGEVVDLVDRVFKPILRMGFGVG